MSAARRMSQLLARDLAGDADREARAGERVAADEGVGQAELAAEHAHLVLEQFAQRLDQREVHPLGQAADIVVALDRHRRAAGIADALDDVGVERALRQEARAVDLLRLGLEHVDEGLADDLALGLGVGDAGEAGQEPVGGVDVDQRDVDNARGTGRRPARPRPRAAGRVSTKTQVSWSPIASWISTAATDESTPPDRPQITLPVADLRADLRRPWRRGSRPCSTSRRSRRRGGRSWRSACAPSGVWTTSGWNWTP